MENIQNNQSCSHQGCKCMHHKVIPILIILLGLTFLLRELGTLSVSTASIIWPIIVILIGCNKLMGGACKCCGSHK